MKKLQIRQVSNIVIHNLSRKITSLLNMSFNQV